MGKLQKDLDMARRIAEQAAQQGGTVYYVGGFVRDRLMGRENKDVDIEVHGLQPAQLEAILDRLGSRMTIGESFGIYGLRGCSLDIAMPRKETLRGSGHRDFDVCVDPFIGTRGAAVRRDFTINAMMQNVLTGEIVDEFGGREDLQRGILRHVSSDTFGEDPLRVLRCAQFAARFGMTAAEETIALCSTMSLEHLAKERVMGELTKALLHAPRPSVFFELLRQMDQLDLWFPELKVLKTIEQDPRHHAEGDVWVHTLQVLNEAAKLREGAANPLGLMLSALTHDMGKAVCTERVGDRIHAYGHEVLGLPIAEGFLRRLTAERELIRYVLNMTELHMKPNALAAVGASVKSSNRMFDSALEPEDLLRLAKADGLGSHSAAGYVSNDAYLTERLAVYRETMARPCVTGKDLIDAGIQPGPGFSEYLAFAHKLHLAGIEKKSALKQTITMARKAEKKTEQL